MGYLKANTKDRLKRASFRDLIVAESIPEAGKPGELPGKPDQLGTDISEKPGYRGPSP